MHLSHAVAQLKVQVYLSVRFQHISTQTGVSDDTSHTSEGGTKSLPESTGGLITSLNPLRIHSSPTEPPRAPTLRECEVIIRQLYNANSLQSQEVSAPNPHKTQVILSLFYANVWAVCVFPQILRIKAVLRDIVFNRKITPESYIMAKTYVADEKRSLSLVSYFGLKRALQL